MIIIEVVGVSMVTVWRCVECNTVIVSAAGDRSGPGSHDNCRLLVARAGAAVESGAAGRYTAPGQHHRRQNTAGKFLGQTVVCLRTISTRNTFVPFTIPTLAF